MTTDHNNAGSVSDILWNLIMHYADTQIFLKYYLLQHIDQDLAGIICSLNLQKEMMQAAYCMSQTINLNQL